MTKPFRHDQIHKNEAILHMENLWNRKLTDHEKHLLSEVYDFSRHIELQQWHPKANYEDENVIRINIGG